MNTSEIRPLNLNEETVFFLGAGASNPYGFPIGTLLKTHMISNLTNGDCKNALVKSGFESLLVKDFGEALIGTYHPTIDIFLEKKKKFRDLGAHLIAYTLLPCENHNLLFPQKE